MIFKDYNDKDLLYSIIDERNCVIIGIQKQVDSFGFCVKAKYFGIDKYELDWCCGYQQFQIEWLFSALRSILEKRKIEEAFLGLPEQPNNSPYYIDIHFIETIKKLAGNFVEEKLPLFMSNHLNNGNHGRSIVERHYI